MVLGRHFLEAGSGRRCGQSLDRGARLAPDRRCRRTRFRRDASETRTASVAATRGFGPMVRAGIADLTVMKTTRSAFAGFPRDRFTTLAETGDRIMATKVTASWAYTSDGDVSIRCRVRGCPVDLARGRSPTITRNPSRHSIWVIARGDPGPPSGGGRRHDVAAEPPPLDGRPEPVRASRTIARSTWRPPSRTA